MPSTVMSSILTTQIWICWRRVQWRCVEIFRKFDGC